MYGIAKVSCGWAWPKPRYDSPPWPRFAKFVFLIFPVSCLVWPPWVGSLILTRAMFLVGFGCLCGISCGNHSSSMVGIDSDDCLCRMCVGCQRRWSYWSNMDEFDEHEQSYHDKTALVVIQEDGKDDEKENGSRFKDESSSYSTSV